MPKRTKKRAKKSVKRTEEETNDDKSDKNTQSEEKKEDFVDEEGINDYNTHLQIIGHVGLKFLSSVSFVEKSELQISCYRLSEVVFRIGVHTN